MWQQIADFLKTAFTVNQTLARHESDIKVLRDSLTGIDARLERLTLQFEAFQQIEQMQRGKFMLEVCLHLAESGKRLPPLEN